MISKISIQNYKSLKDVELECANLNLLTGLNGMGKSSILQAMLLLRQSDSRGYLKKDGLLLNGDLVTIGEGKDALCQDSSSDEISFGISFLGYENEFKWIFGYDSDSDVLPFAEDTQIPENLDSLSLFNSQFQYLSADRWVKNQYERSNFQVVKNRNLGKHGEYTAHYLEHYGIKKGEEVSEQLLYPETTTNDLQSQVSAWMNEISPGTTVNVEKIKGVDSIKLSYEFKSSTGRTNEMTPINVGYGITYVLPIIVSLLSAKPNDILLLENPESHLHPRGQSAIGRLMGLVAQQGVQIFIESHSDHILNGIRIAIRNGQLDKDKAKFYFLNRNNNVPFSTKYRIIVNQNGKIDDRDLRETGVEGFFDQMNKDLETIMFTSIND